MVFTFLQTMGRRRLAGLNSWLGVLLALVVLGLIYYTQLGSKIDVFNSQTKQDGVGKGSLMGTSDVDDESFFVEQNLATLDQGDSRLIKYVRNRYLTPPTFNKPYNLKPEPLGSSQFFNWTKTFFQNKSEGVFIEAGANDGGRSTSRTLLLEQIQGWTGILIECNPLVYPYLKQTHRKAWIATVCISTDPFPRTINFTYPPAWTQSGTVGKSWGLSFNGKPTNWTSLEVDAIPLYTILAAAGFKEIDFFVFDVEGAEFKILKTFPFHLITIKVLLMEIQFLPESERKDLIKFMETKGYVLEIKFNKDYVFVLRKMNP